MRAAKRIIDFGELEGDRRSTGDSPNLRGIKGFNMSKKKYIILFVSIFLSSVLNQLLFGKYMEIDVLFKKDVSKICDVDLRKDKIAIAFPKNLLFIVYLEKRYRKCHLASDYIVVKTNISKPDVEQKKILDLLGVKLK